MNVYELFELMCDMRERYKWMENEIKEAEKSGVRIETEWNEWMNVSSRHVMRSLSART